MSMDNTVIVAIISFAGTLLGTAGGIIASSRLTQYRLEQLERKVEAHTGITARIPLIEEKINGITVRIKNLENNNCHSYNHIDGCQ